MYRAADNIRILAASMVEKANSGHPGGAMGGADFINVLFSEFLVYDPENPEWTGRDRFYLDPGHMSAMLYSALALQGKFSIDELPPNTSHGDGTSLQSTATTLTKYAMLWLTHRPKRIVLHSSSAAQSWARVH